jgi:hypothetical protein
MAVQSKTGGAVYHNFEHSDAIPVPPPSPQQAKHLVDGRNWRCPPQVLKAALDTRAPSAFRARRLRRPIRNLARAVAQSYYESATRPMAPRSG